jgi:hypothetical protein
MAWKWLEMGATPIGDVQPQEDASQVEKQPSVKKVKKLVIKKK